MSITDFLSIKSSSNSIKLIHSWKYGNTLPSCIDQREIQEISICRNYPYSCLMKLIAEILEIENSTVLDLTFGVGEFYRFWKPKYLVVFDVIDWRKKGFKWCIEPNEFYEMSFLKALEVLGDRKFDVVIFDPPYDVHSPKSKDLINEKPYLYYGKENLRTLIKYFPKIAKKYASKYIIAKFMDGRELTVFDLVNAFDRKPDYIIIYRFLARNRPKLNNKVVKTHTYLLIWKMNDD